MMEKEIKRIAIKYFILEKLQFIINWFQRRVRLVAFCLA
jgi:hypothetical protein